LAIHLILRLYNIAASFPLAFKYVHVVANIHSFQACVAINWWGSICWSNLCRRFHLLPGPSCCLCNPLAPVHAHLLCLLQAQVTNAKFLLPYASIKHMGRPPSIHSMIHPKQPVSLLLCREKLNIVTK
jgi:hypothetical protein